MKGKVLITGGAGFIGSHIALKLIEKGYKVSVLDNLLEQIHGDNPDITSPLYCSIKDKVSFIKGDVCNKELLEQALNDVDYVTERVKIYLEAKSFVNKNFKGMF